MPANYTLSRSQRAERASLTKSAQREFDNAVRSARTSAQASRIRARSFSTNRAASAAKSG